MAETEEGRDAYAERVPEDTVLYGAVADALSTFFAHAESNGRELPAFVTGPRSELILILWTPKKSPIWCRRWKKKSSGGERRGSALVWRVRGDRVMTSAARYRREC